MVCSQKQQLKQKPIIIGAGIAGCSLAYEFSRKGFHSTVIDQGGVAMGASGNRRAMVMPMFTMHGNHQEMLTVCGSEYSLNLMSKFGLEIDPQIYELDQNNENSRLYESAEKRHGHDYVHKLTELDFADSALLHATVSSNKSSSDLSKINQESCAELINDKLIVIDQSCDGVWSLKFESGKVLTTDVLIIAAGYQTKFLLEKIYDQSVVNLSTLRGQVAYIKGSKLKNSADLPNVSGQKYLLHDGDDYS